MEWSEATIENDGFSMVLGQPTIGNDGFSMVGHHCTMGPLQWEDGIRDFSFLRGIMTILRQTVTFTF